MKITKHKENWVEFNRVYFKEGFIDLWDGDEANDPNWEDQSMWSLDAFTTFYRLNGEGVWISKNNDIGVIDIYSSLFSIAEDLFAEDVWRILVSITKDTVPLVNAKDQKDWKKYCKLTEKKLKLCHNGWISNRLPFAKGDYRVYYSNDLIKHISYDGSNWPTDVLAWK